MMIVAPVVAIFIAAVVVPLVARRAAGRLAVGVSAAAFAVFATRIGDAPRELALPWIPSLGVEAAFRLDGLSLVFALLITGVGTLVMLYTPAYLEHGTRRLLALLLAFEAAMLGLVLADDTMTLFVFWELTSFASFFLIAFDRSEEARRRARQALLVTAAGGLALLIGLLLMTAGVSTRLSTLPPQTSSAVVILVAAGAFTKSAQVPFHFWLPGAMVAPTPVSAYLHAATMVKAGLYVLARLYPSLGGSPLWTGLLATAGAITFVVAVALAAVQRDAKLVLAYATVAVLGAITMLLGIGGDEAIGAALVLLLAHGAYKASLFLTAGNLDHFRGTRDVFAPVTHRHLPITGGAAALAALGMAGVPPLLGFIAKDAVFAATDGWLLAASIAGGVGLVIAAGLAGVVPYVRGRGWRRDDVAWPMLVGPVVLALAGLVLGLAPDALERALVAPALAAIAGPGAHYDVALWHGVNAPFVIGLASIAAGIAGVWLAWRLRARPRREPVGGRIHDAILDGLTGAAGRLTRAVQHGYMPGYVAAIVGTTVVVVALPLAFEATPPIAAPGLVLDAYEVPLLLLAAISAIAAALFRDRLSSVASLAATGIAVTFVFALYSGPDLAITQLTVETMMVILLVLVFRRIPPSRPQHRRGRVRSAIVAGGAGVLVTVLLLLATATTRFPRDAANAQVQLAAEQEFANVVNAILVDFRALDTLGEITVLAIAGIGVAALAGAVRRSPG